MSTLEDIVCAIEIAASPERVWTVLTDEGLVGEWLGCMGFEARVGALFYMQPDPAKKAAGDTTGATHCEVEVLEPPRRLGFSWFLPDMPVTHVTIEVEPGANGGATVRLVHTGWDQFTEDQIGTIRRMLAAGWLNHVLPNLKRVAEQLPA